MDQQAAQLQGTAADVAALSSMLAAEVLAQSEKIEQLYTAAVEASTHLSRGNKHLREAAKAGRSSQWYVFYVLLIASLMLLLYDWLNK